MRKITQKLSPLLIGLILSTAPPVHSEPVATPISHPVEPAPEQPDTSNEELEEKVHAPQHNFPLAEQLSASTLENKRQQYLNDRGWRLGDNIKKNGDLFYIGWGEANVKERTGSISFIDSKTAAFESALLAAKGEFARINGSRIATQTMQKFLKDELSRPLDLQPNSSTKQIGKKIVALGNSSLDKLLTELGVDAEQFTLKQKQKLAQDRLRKTSTVTAISKVSGVRTLTTFEDNNAVGVLVVYSQKLRQQATDIAQEKLIQKTEIIPGHPSIQAQINQMLPKDSDFIFQHGLRILKDERGNPVLISFAQSGVRANKNSSRFETNIAIKAARSAAKSLSASHIAEFVNATINLQDKTTLEESASMERVTEGGISSIEENLSTGKAIDNFIKQGAKVKLTGIATLKTWTQNHPETGHLIAGEVKIWSPYLSSIATSMEKVKKPNASSRPQPPIENRLKSGANFESDASF
ncbi:MAG: hypothetical protein KUG80_04800 [Gammaproteobacteria bacterium]|nr:hypothetical protein [Gammaproteobacteria bacterium]